MIVMYTSAGCSSCRKAKEYMRKNNLPFIEKKLEYTRLNDKEIRYLLERSENGSDDLISNRSKIIKEGNRDIETMKLSDLVSFIRENPSILKRPIIIDNSSLEIGYDEEEISIFKKNNEKRLSLAL
ncbi:MAG: transcriptional regulator Spx [Erysipelotrichaceae bacterium]|nr:transcriptional regulator Spx [Erysipelotrichaceae bacterium]MCR5096737.1 Spx/MgsR family RNA polymerase-binding regulatory protein [Erysipelotrichaceae bacterium]